MDTSGGGRMDEFVKNLVGRLDIDRPTAERVFLFLRENVDQLSEWLGAEAAREAPPGPPARSKSPS